MSVYLIDLQFLSSFVYFFFMGVGIYEKETLASQGKYKSIPQTHCILTYPIVLYTWKDGTGHIHICNMYWIVLRILKPPELISLAVWFRLTGLYCFAPLNELEVFFVSSYFLIFFLWCICGNKFWYLVQNIQALTTWPTLVGWLFPYLTATICRYQRVAGINCLLLHGLLTFLFV